MRPWLAFVIHVPVVTVTGVPAQPPYVVKGPFTVITTDADVATAIVQAKSLALLGAAEEIKEAKIEPTQLVVRLIQVSH